MLYSRAILVNVSPLCTVIVAVPPAIGLFVLSGKGIVPLLFSNTCSVNLFLSTCPLIPATSPASVYCQPAHVLHLPFGVGCSTSY